MGSTLDADDQSPLLDLYVDSDHGGCTRTGRVRKSKSRARIRPHEAAGSTPDSAPPPPVSRPPGELGLGVGGRERHDLLRPAIAGHFVLYRLCANSSARNAPHAPSAGAGASDGLKFAVHSAAPGPLGNVASAGLKAAPPPIGFHGKGTVTPSRN